MLVAGFLLAATITITNSTNVVTHTSASATGGSASAEVYTNVNGSELHERRESADGAVEITVHTDNEGSTVLATTSTSTASTTATTTAQRMISLVHKILALFGLTLADLQ